MPHHSFPAILESVRPRDAIDLMAWPCFALGKTPRYAPIAHERRGKSFRVWPAAGTAGPGLATVWDADVLIWAVSQLSQGCDEHLDVSPRLAAPAFQILRFLGRGTGQSRYRMLGPALDRLAGTMVEASFAASAPARFRWLECWQRTADGVELVLPEWLFAAVVERRRVLTVDPGYFRLTGGIERWLWRLLRRQAGRQSTGWEVALSSLHGRSGSLARATDFAVDLRRIARASVLPGYALEIVMHSGEEWLHAVRSAETLHSAGVVPGDKPRYLSTQTVLPL